MSSNSNEINQEHIKCKLWILFNVARVGSLLILFSSPSLSLTSFSLIQIFIINIHIQRPKITCSLPIKLIAWFRMLHVCHVFTYLVICIILYFTVYYLVFNYSVFFFKYSIWNIKCYSVTVKYIMTRKATTATKKALAAAN